MSKTLKEQEQSNHFGERMTDCVTKREQRQKRGKREDRRKQRDREKERGGVRGKREERGRMTGNNFCLEERPLIEELLSNNVDHIREHADTHTIPSPYSFPLYSTRCAMRKI